MLEHGAFSVSETMRNIEAIFERARDRWPKLFAGAARRAEEPGGELRTFRGRRRWRRLDDKDLREMHRRYLAGEYCEAISGDYGMSMNAMLNAFRRRGWPKREKTTKGGAA